MMKLYHHYLNGKNILFTASSEHKNYLEMEFHFPYRGIKADLFDENANFNSESLNETLQFMSENIVTTLRVVHQKFREMSFGERAELQEKDLVRKKILSILENDCISYCRATWGKTLLDSVEDNVNLFIKNNDLNTLKYSELEYTNIYKELLYKYKECCSLEGNYVSKTENFWFEKFQRDDEYRMYTLKKLKYGYPRHSLPDLFTKTVDYDQFIKEQKYFLPFFIGTQFGIYPKITDQMKRDLEGQKIAILGKSLLSGHEAALTINEMIDGKIVKLKTFINDNEGTNILTNAVFTEDKDEKFDSDQLVYKVVTSEYTAFVKKEDAEQGMGFMLTMLWPYQNVQWDYYKREVVCEQEKQELMHLIIEHVMRVYGMVEASMEIWQQHFEKFRAKNHHMSADFMRNYYLEINYESIRNNGAYFPEDYCGQWAKCFFKTVMREIIEEGVFHHKASKLPLMAIEHQFREENRTVIDITPYSEEQHQSAFDKLNESEKLNLYAAMKEGYGSQFDRLLAKHFHTKP